MEILAGIVLAFGVSLSASLAGFDRDRAFYPVVLIVIASYYGLFAVMAGSASVLGLESLAIALFLGLALLGFRRNLWWIPVALLAHGLFDFFHGRMIDNPGVPAWWPAFCLAYDGIAAAYLGGLLLSGRLPARKSDVF